MLSALHLMLGAESQTTSPMLKVDKYEKKKVFVRKTKYA